MGMRINKNNSELVSIIIVNFQTRDLIELTLGMIKNYTKYPHEIIVVDNGSTDGSVEFLQNQEREHQNLRFVKNKITERGSRAHGLGLDKGLSIAKGSYIVTLDSDAFPVKKGWLSELIKIYKKKPKIKVVGIRKLWGETELAHPTCLLIRKETMIENGLSFQDLHGFDTALYISHFLMGLGYKIGLIRKTKEGPEIGKIYGGLVCHLMAGTMCRIFKGRLEDYPVISKSENPSKTNAEIQQNNIKKWIKYYRSFLQN